MNSLRAWLRTYYLATPGFVLIDIFCGANVRAAAFESHPWAKWSYYGLCFGCFLAMRAKPQFTGLITMGESLFNVVSLIIAFIVPYYAFIGNFADGSSLAEFPMTVERTANFLIAGLAASAAFHTHDWSMKEIIR